MKRLSKKKLLTVIKNTPLIAIDLIIKNKDEEILLGLRTNSPAKNFWFTPGGRIRKNETISKAFQRIAFEELELNLNIEDAKFAGIFEHFYDENFSEKKEFGTHYVVLAYHLSANIKLKKLPITQHNSYRLEKINILMQNPRVHQNTKNYFSNSFN